LHRGKEDQRPHPGIKRQIGRRKANQIGQKPRHARGAARPPCPERPTPRPAQEQKKAKHPCPGEEPDEGKTHRIQRPSADRHPVQHRIGGEGDHGKGRQKEETHHLPRELVN
jgi:hypothetical protein